MLKNLIFISQIADPVYLPDVIINSDQPKDPLSKIIDWISCNSGVIFQIMVSIIVIEIVASAVRYLIYTVRRD